jgi:hypothetical protein
MPFAALMPAGRLDPAKRKRLSIVSTFDKPGEIFMTRRAVMATSRTQ